MQQYSYAQGDVMETSDQRKSDNLGNKSIRPNRSILDFHMKAKAELYLNIYLD